MQVPTVVSRRRAPLFSRNCSCLVAVWKGDLKVHSTPSLPNIFTRPSLVPT